jgi:hypothetical protein
MPWSPIGVVQPRVRRTTKKSNWGPYMHWFYLVKCSQFSPMSSCKYFSSHRQTSLRVPRLIRHSRVAIRGSAGAPFRWILDEEKMTMSGTSIREVKKVPPHVCA